MLRQAGRRPLPPGAGTSPGAGVLPDAGALAAFLSDVVTGLWRVRQKLSPLEGAEASGETRSLARAIASTWDALKQGGVEIAEHTGEFITGGERLHVLTFQPTPGLDRERVIETIKPTVYYRGRMIQAGQVIVGTPG